MEKNCPCCGRHCPADQLSCPRGRAYFGAVDGSRAPADHAPAEEKKEEKLIVLLRRCGHFLHHSAGTEDTASLLNALTTEERATLEGLLEKCLDHWEKH